MAKAYTLLSLPWGLYAAMVQMTVPESWLESLLEERTRTFRDECGSFYAHLEGTFGGETILLWTPQQLALQALEALPKAFKGRLVLGFDRSLGYQIPFERALYWSEPRKALVLQPEEGLAAAFAGAKEIAEGQWVPWNDPREGRRLEVEVSSSFTYTESRTYKPWSGTLAVDLPSLEGPKVGAAGWDKGIPTFGVGLVGLDRSLEAILRAWRIV